MFVASFLFLTSFIGCGDNASRAPTVLDDAGERGKKEAAPKPISKEELQAAEAKLAELKKAIAGKEKELADLRTEADALRRLIDRAKGTGVSVYTKAEDLFKDMPPEAYPKSGPSAGIERAAARKWCKANLIGRTIEWTTHVKEVQITGDGPFTVTLQTERPRLAQALIDDLLLYGFVFDKSFFLRAQACWAMIRESGRYRENLTEFSYECSEAEAKKLREFKGKLVICRATLTAVDVSDNKMLMPGPGAPIPDNVCFVLGISAPMIDGFRPEPIAPKKKSP